jgi:hypothetical protein
MLKYLAQIAKYFNITNLLDNGPEQMQTKSP